MTKNTILLICIFSTAVMSPKKSPEVSQKAVEAEIAVLAGESSNSKSDASSSADIHDLSSLFTNFLKMQEALHSQLLKVLTASTQNS